MIAIVVGGLPQAKERPRFARNGRVYTPKKTSAWEHSLAWQAKAAMGGRKPAEGPVSLVVVAVHARPQARPAHVPLSIWKQGLRCPAITRSDLDNCVKAVGDGLNGIAWGDDRQVAHVEAFSVYAAKGETPSVAIRVVADVPGWDGGGRW